MLWISFTATNAEQGSDERSDEESLKKEKLQPFTPSSATCGAYCTVRADPTFKVIDVLGACAAASLSNGKKMSLLAPIPSQISC